MLANGFKRPIPNFPLACGIFVGLVAVDWAYRAVNGTNKHRREDPNPPSVPPLLLDSGRPAYGCPFVYRDLGRALGRLLIR